MNKYYMEVFHEIKNSITLINSYLQLLEKKHPEIAQADYWDCAIDETNRLRTIVTALSLVKPAPNLQQEIVDLRGLIQECCDEFRCFSGREGITCAVTLPETPLRASVDSNQLRHVFSNLLKNACEAMAHQGELLVAASGDGTDILIQITDFGCGIPEHILDQVFEPFITTKENGSGLGLHITKQIITAHNGTIQAKSREGYGCTFLITLPEIPN